MQGEPDAGSGLRESNITPLGRTLDCRVGRTWVLVATDLIGRGMDFLGVNTVINYDFPNSTTDYIHRIGRSGRYGRKGASINLVCPREMRMQADIEAFYGRKVLPLPLDLNIF